MTRTYIYIVHSVYEYLLAFKQSVSHDVILVGRVAPPCCSGCTNGGMDVVVALLWVYTLLEHHPWQVGGLRAQKWDRHTTGSLAYKMHAYSHSKLQLGLLEYLMAILSNSTCITFGPPLSGLPSKYSAVFYRRPNREHLKIIWRSYSVLLPVCTATTAVKRCASIVIGLLDAIRIPITIFLL